MCLSVEIDPKSIIQGDLEDCYLLSAISVLAEQYKSKVRDLYIIQEYNDYGLYGMVFYVDGEWRTVFVDDQLPVKTENGIEKLVFARSLKQEALWVPILEKCYAKLYKVAIIVYIYKLL